MTMFRPASSARMAGVNTMAIGKARALFVGGTSSNAGKSWMATAICAWLRTRGRRRRAVQGAEHVEQLVSVPGRRRDWPRAGGAGRSVRARAGARHEPDSAQAERQRHEPGRRERARVEDACRRASTTRTPTSCARKVLDAYEDLASRFDVIVIEGAGSVTELNLRDHDLVNLGLVTRIRAPWLLVADIERGGVFGSVIGTRHLLTSDERALFRGFAINKFRGDRVALRRRRADARGANGVALLRRVSVSRPTCISTPRTAWRSRRVRACPRHPGADSRSSGSRTSRTPRIFVCSRGRTGSRHLQTTSTISSSCPGARTRSPISRGSGRRAWRTGCWPTTARARRSSASVAATRCSDARIAIRAGSSRRRRSRQASGCCRP